ncbi:MAG: DNA polymerase III subunit beta [Planctomycetota bacterium]|nr:DNA polymerase III subunit beta [Planctomycetota bacterium]
MKVVCDRASLLEAINLVSGVVATRTPRPQLTCVKLTAAKEGKGGTLTLTATDAEISLRLRVDNVDVEQPGETLIPADKLRQIISAEDNEPTLTLEASGDTVDIRGEDAHFKVYGHPPEEFPAVAEFKAAVSGSGGNPPAKAVFKHPAKSLSEVIARTIFATARENTRYAINGVLLSRDGKKLEMVATDGRRLALCRATLTEKDGPSVKCIIPTKALTLLQRLLGSAQGDVDIAITDNQIFFNISQGESGADESAVLASNLVEGAFPPYEDVIPKDNDKMVHVDRDVLFSAVRRAALLTNEESRGVRLSFTGQDNRLDLSSRAPEMGEANIQVDLTDYKGEDVSIGFNPGFITDALKVISDPDVIIELKKENKPGLIRSGDDFVYVVMPVTLQ